MKAPSIIECHPMNRTPEQIKHRQNVCTELMDAILKSSDNGDLSLLETVIDEYVYLLSDNRVDELITLCNNELEDD